MLQAETALAVGDFLAAHRRCLAGGKAREALIIALALERPLRQSGVSALPIRLLDDALTCAERQRFAGALVAAAREARSCLCVDKNRATGQQLQTRVGAGADTALATPSRWWQSAVDREAAELPLPPPAVAGADPDDESAWRSWAKAVYEMGRLDEARARCRHALDALAQHRGADPEPVSHIRVAAPVAAVEDAADSEKPVLEVSLSGRRFVLPSEVRRHACHCVGP